MGARFVLRFQLRYKNCSNSPTGKSAPKGGKTGDTLILRLAQTETRQVLCYPHVRIPPTCWKEWNATPGYIKPLAS